jgi:predicted GNAT superfamily acetyltransferase
MFSNVEASLLVSWARSAADRAASLARVRVVDESEMDRFGEVEALLIKVWGTPQNEPPIPSIILRSISHAGCNVTAAYDEKGVLCGSAVAIVSPENLSTYSLIAGVLPEMADSGVGFALKQHQRAWSLARGLDKMVWTFDPLVSGNARFNLTKLGAYSAEYIPNFYGVMGDELNFNDESDRLIAVWPLTAARTIGCSWGEWELVELPDFSPADVRVFGPDGHPVLIESSGSLWCRVPEDIVKLRRQFPDQAAEWRTCIRNIFTTAFVSGHTALGVTRAGWYRLVTGGAE